jgi:putative membrane-bound dehydrogenase-like protein
MQAIATAFLLGLLAATPGKVETPRVVDPRLSIRLFAADPEIVTPTGIAVDDRGRVFVIECHTHFRPDNYPGPPADRIRVFEDTDHDGKADRITTFYEGTKWTMALAIARDGALYVATRSEVFRLRDLDGDGKAEQRTPIARLETKGAYPHNGLSGLAFDALGNLYFGLGENLGEPYKLVGSDGTTLTGGGEGGNIYKCRPDGSKLARIATGFWNPFGLAFDTYGRLFAVDNDPDSRPPCRLLHIVDGGDYGYRFRYGRKGVHPFIAWDGEIPGTLPMVAGTGEAPSGIVAYESDNLPDDYRGDLLVTSWGDHRIDRFRLRERGASFRSAAEPIVTGGEDFRPVGIAVAPDGSIYVSDWVDKSYPVHGRGRIWQIRGKDSRPRSKPDDMAHPDRRIRERAARGTEGNGRQALTDAALSDPNPRARAIAIEALAASEKGPVGTKDDASPDVRALVVRLLPATVLDLKAIAARDNSALVRSEALRRIADPAAISILRDAIATGDPYLGEAAREGLTHSADPAALLKLMNDANPTVRVAALLLLRQSGRVEARQSLPKFLADADPTVRFAAIQWVGEEGLEEFRPQVEASVSKGVVTRLLFEGYLATLERLDGARSINQTTDGQDRVLAIVNNPKTSPAILRRALRVLRPDHPGLTISRLKTLIASDDPGVRVEAIRTLRESPDPGRSAILADIAKDASRPESIRAEAIVGLSGDDPKVRDLLAGLFFTGPPTLRQGAFRSLGWDNLTEGERHRTPIHVSIDEPALTDLDGWVKRLEGPGNADEGERIFFHPKGPGCYRCHEIDGRGGRIGPELSATGRSLDRRRLIESIIAPSKEVAPAFVPWLISRTDGTTVTGLLIGETIDGKQTYAESTGKIFSISPTEVAERRPQPTSIMPDNFPRQMTTQEFRDLLAFLQKR